jgi:hypothetical protein
MVVESTFVIGLDESDPTLQIMDSTDNADANGRANQRAISVEVVGDGVGPFTDWQVREIIRIGRWAAANHPIERRIIPSEAASGFGWHVMFGAPGPWTSSNGKVCPGAARIAQLKSVIFPAIFSDTEPEEDMPSANEIATALTALLERRNSPLQRLMAASESSAKDSAKALGLLEKLVAEAATPKV